MGDVKERQKNKEIDQLKSLATSPTAYNVLPREALFKAELSTY